MFDNSESCLQELGKSRQSRLVFSGLSAFPSELVLSHYLFILLQKCHSMAEP